ncbi:MAG: sugar phosphate isomerase/epimerase family protein [Deefgea sp.]
MKNIIACTTRPYQILPFAAACEQIAAAGFSELAVYYSASGPDQYVLPVNADSTSSEIAAARNAAAAAGVKPAMLLGYSHPELGLAKAIDEYKRLIDNASALGSQWLLDCGIDDLNLRHDYYKLMRQVAPHAAQAGIQISLKPHGGITLSLLDLLQAQQKIAHPAFSWCFDPGNLIYYSNGAINPEDCITPLLPWLTTGIIKDCVINAAGPDVAITAGEGLVDFRQTLSELVKGGFTGPLYIECVGGTELGEIDRNVRATQQLISQILTELA